jgi:hypothetical protein
MISRINEDFRVLLRALPLEARRQARAAYLQFKRDPYHPSLRFKRVSNRAPIYSARVGHGYRVLGLREKDDSIIWFWIGTHAEYDKLLSE